MFIPLYSTYCILYGKLVLSSYIRNYLELVNQINIELLYMNKGTIAEV